MSEFRILRKIEPILLAKKQILVKTADGHPDFKRLGRWSRQSSDQKHVFETHVDLMELAIRIGATDPTMYQYIRNSYIKNPYKP
jgi:hypothetical protein